MPVVIGNAEYPEHILEDLEKEYKVYRVDATEESKKLGNPKVFKPDRARCCGSAYGFYERAVV